MENQNALINSTDRSLSFVSPTRVLVIEDEPSWQAILSHSLRQCNGGNIQLRFVRSAKQALDVIYKERKFDLILSDHLLDGEVTGLDLWAKCRSQFLSQPFILISAKKRSTISSQLSNIDERVPLIIEKPFDLKHFKSIIEIYLNPK
jgi:DNA-binding NtrC family response regulator